MKDKLCSRKNLSEEYLKLFKQYRKNIQNVSDSSLPDYRLEMSFESLRDWAVVNTLDELKNWYSEVVSKKLMSVERVPINSLKDWYINENTGDIQHASGDFFEIHGIRVKSNIREVGQGWDQPILRQIDDDGGILGLLRKRFNGIPHYLCEAKVEPGNYNIVQISPTLQATFANLNRSHHGRAPSLTNFFWGNVETSGGTILFKQWLSEDGGRFFNKRNLGMMVEVPETFHVNLPSENYRWFSLFQIKSLINSSCIINPHVRSIISHG